MLSVRVTMPVRLRKTARNPVKLSSRDCRNSVAKALKTLTLGQIFLDFNGPKRGSVNTPFLRWCQ